jgi:predicted unusual protein kinase regulating ubiquinone biosynthesis (AarF/ABC1/UbiB family)
MFLTHVYTWCKLATQVSLKYLWHGKTPTFYQQTLQLLRNENILFTKIFQSLATTANLSLPPDLQAELLRYTTNVSYTEQEINYNCLAQIEADYNVHIDLRVANSGMIALIFKGKDASGNPVIIKLKRNGITKHLREGCAAVSLLYDWSAYFFRQNIVVRILKPFIRNITDIIEQCDFDREIRNLKQAKEDFAPLTFIQIPTVYNKDTKSTDFILMEFIEGTHTPPPNTSHADRIEYLEKFGTFTTYAFLYNTIQNTDLHSGNIIFTPTGLGIIDFGMAIQPTEEMHEMMLKIGEMIRDETPIHEIDFIESFKDLFVPPLDKSKMENPQQVEDICLSIAQPLLEQLDMDELNITDNLDRLTAHLNSEISLHKDLYKILLGLSMMGGKVTIFGLDYKKYADEIIATERRACTRAFAYIM